MNNHDAATSSRARAETLMLEHFRREPFHNLYHVLGLEPRSPVFGGTCSDKALSFLGAARAHGFDAVLHAGWIRGRKTHRLVRLNIAGEVCIADVGNGWPTLRLFPRDEPTSYEAFGMRFWTTLGPDCLHVHTARHDGERVMMRIPFVSKAEKDILEDIKSRFEPHHRYPFADGIRFSQVVGDRFLFLRDDCLGIYSEGSQPEFVGGITRCRLATVLLDFFGFDLDAFRRNAME